MSQSAKIADARRTAESCRVTFDLEKLRVNIESGLDGEQVTKADVFDWLEALGFTQSPDGQAWVGRRRVLRHFAVGEVLTMEAIAELAKPN